jgi:hypothetical protein
MKRNKHYKYYNFIVYLDVMNSATDDRILRYDYGFVKLIAKENIKQDRQCTYKGNIEARSRN